MRKLLARATAITSTRGWLVVAVVYVVTLAVSARRFWHWGPDTRYYLAMTYRYSGLSEHEAGRRTYEYLGRFSWFKDYCYFACEPNSPEATFGHLFHGDVGGMVATRVVYPLVSVPFVWLLGPQGMLVAPLLAYTAGIIMAMAFVSRVVGGRWAVLAAVMLIVPTTVSSYALYTYTEALAMAFVMGCILTLPIARKSTRRDLVVFGVLLVLVAFTRQFHPVVVAAVALAWLGGLVFTRKWRNEWLPFVGVSAIVMVIAAVAQQLAGPNYSLLGFFKQMTGAQSPGDLPAAAAKVAVNLVKAEIWNLGLDIPLAIVCAFAMIGVLYRFRSPIALLALGAVLGTFVLNVLNTEPSHFRYYVTAFPFIAIIATAVVAHLIEGRKGAFIPVPAEEPEPPRVHQEANKEVLV